MEYAAARANLEAGRKIGIGVSYDCLELLFPQVAVMKGFDQKNERHRLTLDEHTKEVDRLLNQDLDVLSLPPRKKGLVLLAAKLHDIGKPDTATPHKNKEGQMTYIGHEKRSAEIARDILDYFDLDETEKKFVLTIVALHAKSLSVANNFRNNDQPAGKQLGFYGDFLGEIREMPGSETDDGWVENVRLILTITKADVRAGIDNQITDNPADIVAKIGEDVAGIERLESAIPAIMMAVIAKRNGDQTAAVLKEESGSYRYATKQR